MAQMNRAFQDWLVDPDASKPDFLKMYPNPIWFRPYEKTWYKVAGSKEKTVAMLEALGCKCMVVGHKPLNNVFPIWGGIVYGVDTLISNPKATSFEALEIYKGVVRPIRTG